MTHPSIFRSVLAAIGLLILGAALALLGAWGVGALRRPPPPAGGEEEAIRRVLADQQEAWNRGDLEGFMAGYWKSPELSFSSGRDRQLGWQQTFDRYKKRYQDKGREMGKLTFSDVEVRLLRPDLALVQGVWKLDKAQPADGRYTLLVQRLPEGWRITLDHTSDGPPPAKKRPADD
jgi:beta-aspartyl-peptidase (threonine type)